jgi:hypothetical protein
MPVGEIGLSIENVKDNTLRQGHPSLVNIK